MKKIIKIFLVITCLCTFTLQYASGQNNPYGKVRGDTLYSTGWSFGLNMGAYFANKYQANFYNGSNQNVDSINYIFGNYYRLNEIKAALGGDTFRLLELPAAMHYKPAVMIGFFGKYNMTHNFGIFLQCNYQSLKAEDAVTIALGPAQSYQLKWDSIILCPIWGKEDRMNIDLGLSKDFVLDESVHVFAEAGMNINYVHVKEHKIAIQSFEESLINIFGDQPYVPNTQMQEYTVRLGGWGMGGFLSGGFRFIFNNHVSLDPGATFYWNEVKLLGYTAFRPNFTVFARLSYQNLVSKKKFNGE